MIFGERIRLRAIEREDLPLYVNWLNDPEVRQYLPMFLPISQAFEQDWYENMRKQPLVEQGLMIEIKTPQGWVPIGNVRIFNIELQNRNAELGIMIGEKQYWNQGYGSETMRLMLKHGFNTLNLHRISLWVDAHNLGGIRAYEKAGFVHEGRKRQAVFQDGRYYDLLLMGILRTEWQENLATSGEDNDYT